MRNAISSIHSRALRRTMNRAVLAGLLTLPLTAWTAPALSAQAVVPAPNLVVYRRQQGFGSTLYTWGQFQDGNLVQSFSSLPIVVPTGKHLVVTGIRYWFNGTTGVDLSVGPSVSGLVNNLYMKLIRVTPSGSQTLLEGAEHFTNGLSFPGGSKVDIKVAKVSAGSSDTIVWCWLYGYLETP